MAHRRSLSASTQSSASRPHAPRSTLRSRSGSDDGENTTPQGAVSPRQARVEQERLVNSRVNQRLWYSNPDGPIPDRNLTPIADANNRRAPPPEQHLKPLASILIPTFNPEFLNNTRSSTTLPSDASFEGAPVGWMRVRVFKQFPRGVDCWSGVNPQFLYNNESRVAVQLKEDAYKLLHHVTIEITGNGRNHCTLSHDNLQALVAIRTAAEALEPLTLKISHITIETPPPPNREPTPQGRQATPTASGPYMKLRDLQLVGTRLDWRSLQQLLSDHLKKLTIMNTDCDFRYELLGAHQMRLEELNLEGTEEFERAVVGKVISHLAERESSYPLHTLRIRSRPHIKPQLLDKIRFPALRIMDLDYNGHIMSRSGSNQYTRAVPNLQEVTLHVTAGSGPSLVQENFLKTAFHPAILRVNSDPLPISIPERVTILAPASS
ncbi:hypothetical protein HDV00_003940 [Rhizophlyctis rosea]|nr:hypothetical protein HDV00_003940 [Rhizophlyctis rosea]